MENAPPQGECPHCGDDSNTCVSMRCLRCAAVLCSRLVTPVAPESPFYPYKHRVSAHNCGPAQPMLLPE